jgi:uncharacterized repeat protein (TIGR04052 family)
MALSIFFSFTLYLLIFSIRQRAFQKLSRALIMLNLAFILAACQPETQKKNVLRVNFTPHFAGQALQCGQAISLRNQQWQTLAFSMFLSEFSLNDTKSVILDDNDWQSQQVGLIRYVADCGQQSANMSISGVIENVSNSNTETPDLYTLMRSNTLDTKQKIRLNFTIGLPFKLNHQNPLIQPSPLNDSSMFWAWRNGYKFIRWDMQSTAVKSEASTSINNTASNLASDSWSFHLGSIGCESAAMVRAPKQACAQSNSVAQSLLLDKDSISIDEISQHETSLVLNVDIHLDEILGSVELTRQNSCMFSSIDNITCNELLENLKSQLVFQ